MKRRSFIKASVVTASVSGIASTMAMASAKKKDTPEVYELRTYILSNNRQQKLVLDYWQNAAIPALNKTGSKNIGVFTEYKPEAQSKIFVLIPYKTAEDFLKANDKLQNDATYLQAGKDYLQAPAKQPAYDRIESSLLQAFTGFPKMKVPANEPRIFELRRYESSGEAAGQKKIDMFDNVGEIAIFERVGLTPVFFAETIIGANRPNLTYMLTFDDMAGHDKSWKAFGSDAEWNRIKALPGYEDANIVSKISRTFLEPASFSQV